MKSFKQYFTENIEEATKLTDPNATYKVWYYGGSIGMYDFEYKLKDEDIDQYATYVYVDKEGYLHSPDNQTPAKEEIRPEENLKEHTFYKHGKIHRDGDLPASVETVLKGDKFSRLSYYKDGKHHRLTGPAEIIFEYDGRVYEQEYWINNKEYSKEEFDEYVKGIESKEDREMLSDLGQTFE